MTTAEQALVKALQEIQDLKYENKKLRELNGRLRKVKGELKQANQILRKSDRVNFDRFKEVNQRAHELRDHNRLLEQYANFISLDLAINVVVKAKDLKEAEYKLRQAKSYYTARSYEELEVVKKIKRDI